MSISLRQALRLAVGPANVDAAVEDQIDALELAIKTLVDATWNGDGTDMSVVRYLPDGSAVFLLRRLIDLRVLLATAAEHADTYGI